MNTTHPSDSLSDITPDVVAPNKTTSSGLLLMLHAKFLRAVAPLLVVAGCAADPSHELMHEKAVSVQSRLSDVKVSPNFLTLYSVTNRVDFTKNNGDVGFMTVNGSIHAITLNDGRTQKFESEDAAIEFLKVALEAPETHDAAPM